MILRIFKIEYNMKRLNSKIILFVYNSYNALISLFYLSIMRRIQAMGAKPPPGKRKKFKPPPGQIPEYAPAIYLNLPAYLF